ncbi:MAG: chromate efflux transporter [Pseudomonadota bacterium]
MNNITWGEMTRVFGRIGLISFGGPAAQIALMHHELVEKRRWLTEETYLRALSLCMLLPGPEAMQLATYAGWRLRGTPGGILAGLLFVLPGALVIALLALLYALYGQLPLVQAAFLGIKATVVVIVFQALQKLSSTALNGKANWALAIAAFFALFVFALPFPIIIVLAALYGLFSSKNTIEPGEVGNQKPAQTVRTIAIWSSLWGAPLLLLWITNQDFLLQLGFFFSQLAVVTFGGAYAVLAYMTQTVVQEHGWISTQQMIDALGLAETTPGPLILVTEFVALLAGYAHAGLIGAITAGILALWVTFTPCFLWIFVAGPYLERISNEPRLAAALEGIKAAVVGVIANLSVWFALHVLFGNVTTGAFLALPTPELESADLRAGMLMICAACLMLLFNRGLPSTMAVMAGLGVLSTFLVSA